MDQYQFQMTYRLERMTRAERIAAEEQAGRIAQGLFGLGQALARAMQRGVPDVGRLGGATMPLRRSV
jgi:hypothetical protein